MADTTFIDGTTIEAPWMNDVNDFVYKGGLPDVANVLYVATTGNDTTGDGSLATPFATVQKAVDTITQGPIIAGSWGISIAAGTYSSAAARRTIIGSSNMSGSTPNDTAYNSNGVLTKNYIYIYGPDVGYNPVSNPEPVPTAIFDGGGASVVGFQVEGPAKVLFRNIKGINYTGTTSSAFISAELSLIRCENIHCDGNNMDISSLSGKMEVKGGALENATLYSLRSLFNNKHEIGNQTAGGVGQGPFVRGANIGILAQEGSTGHCDYVTFEDCNDAIRVTVNSRVNYSGSEFLRCIRGVRVDDGNVFSSSSDFHLGTADATTEPVVIQGTGYDPARDAYANGILVTDYLTTPITHTGTLVSTDILVKTLPQGRWSPNLFSIRKPQHIEFVAFGTMTGTGASHDKQFKLRLGTTPISISTATTDTGGWECRAHIVFTDSNVQKANISFLSHSGTVRSTTVTLAEDNMAADLDLQFEVQLNDITDTIVIEHAHFKSIG